MTAQLIEDLVSRRKTEDESQSKTIQERKRNLELIRDKAIYMLSISVHTGSFRVTIDCRDLGVNDEFTDAVEAGEGKHIIRIPIFAELVKSGTRLASMRARIQKKMVYSEPYWFCPEEQMDAVSQGVSELLAACEELRAEALTAYDEGYTDYLRRVAAILVRVTPEDQLEEKLEEYAGLFPTREDVENNFRVEIQGPIRVPSLIEQSGEDARLAANLAQETEARQRLELLEAENQATRQLQAEWSNSIRESLSQSLASARDEILGTVADTLERLEGVEPGRIPKQMERALNTNLQRLEALVSFDSSLSDLVQRTNELRQVATTSISPESLQERLNRFKANLQQEAESLRGTGKGHKALAQWMIID